MIRRRYTHGFTLVELLVVVAIVVTLLAILLPALGTARLQARLVKAHADLHRVEVALAMYGDEQRDRLPPVRFSCSLRTDFELPIELGRYHHLPADEEFLTAGAVSGFVTKIQLRDVFHPTATYRYLAPGAAIFNEHVVVADWRGLWVPAEFPDTRGEAGAYHSDVDTSPVRYALWSVGPDILSPKFTTTPGRIPLPGRFWCRGARDTGVITHYQARSGTSYRSP